MNDEGQVTLNIGGGVVKLSINPDGSAKLYFEYPSFGTVAQGAGTLTASELIKLRQWVSANVGEIVTQDVGG